MPTTTQQALRVAALLACCISQAAIADEGELTLDLPLAFEVAHTSHPATSAAVFSPQATNIIKPRIGTGLRYGLTPSFSAGIGFQAAFSTAIQTPEVTIENSTGDLLTAQYVELMTPVVVGYRFDSGAFISGGAELELAPMFTYWGVQDLVDLSDLDDAGLPRSLEKKAQDVWLVSGLARLTLLFDMRLFDVFIGAIGPHAALSMNQQGQLAVHAGITLRSSLVWGGPL